MIVKQRRYYKHEVQTPTQPDWGVLCRLPYGPLVAGIRRCGGSSASLLSRRICLQLAASLTTTAFIHSISIIMLFRTGPFV